MQMDAVPDSPNATIPVNHHYATTVKFRGDPIASSIAARPDSLPYRDYLDFADQSVNFLTDVCPIRDRS